MSLQIICLFVYGALIGFKSDKKAMQNFREIIIFAYSDDDSSLKKQLVILNSDAKGLAERDLNVAINIWAKDKKLAHQKYKISKNKFTLVLIGKDGGEKYRSEKIITSQKLYAIIDAMPMRVYEMRKQ